MGNSVRLRALALVTTGLLGLGSLGGVAAAAAADPGPDHADRGKHLGQTKDNGDKANGQDSDKGRPGHNHGHSHGHHDGHAHAPGQQSTPGHQAGQHGQGGVSRGPSSTGAHGDPAGNNGTVKIAGPDDEVGHPSNNPHPGCTFLVEWFGFDEGSDVVSTVSFAAQAPTSDVVLGGTSPTQVFVGGDPAGGGTDLDGRQSYTLTFQGTPHPKQGYHVKLTVATPRSLGNDTKTKVFWVAPCTDTAPGTTGDDTETRGADVSGGSLHHSTGTRDSSAQGVLGETFTADQGVEAETAAVAGSAAVPTAIDAGEDSMLPEWARSPLPLTLISFALVLVGVGIVLRNRSRA